MSSRNYATVERTSVCWANPTGEQELARSSNGASNSAWFRYNPSKGRAISASSARTAPGRSFMDKPASFIPASACPARCVYDALNMPHPLLLVTDSQPIVLNGPSVLVAI